MVRHNLYSAPALSAADFAFIISAGMIRRWKIPGQDAAPVIDDLCQAQYYTNHDQVPYMNQLFAAMYNLVLCRISKMDLIAPSSIAEIFEEKNPNYGGNDGEERHLVGPELIADLQWLIYNALLQSSDQGARGEEHKKYYDTYVTTFQSRWGT